MGLVYGKLGPKEEDCVVYAVMRKSGSTTIRKTLASPVFTHQAELLPEEKLRKCFWFTFIRNPVSRMISGFYERVDKHILEWDDTEAGCKSKSSRHTTPHKNKI
jgi:hypothetical protein